MALSKITKESYANKGVIGLPDTPQLSTAEMQRRFEEISIDVIIPAFNSLVDELSGENGAKAIATSDGSNVQDKLNAIGNYGASIAELQADNITNKANIGALQTDNTTNQTNISALQADNATNKADISALQTDNATNKSNIASNTSDIATLKADNTTNKANISSNTTEITSTKTRVGALEADNDVNKSAIASLTSDVTDLSAKKHTHSNKSVIDALSKDSDGDLNFEGQKISGGGGSSVQWQQNTMAGTKIAEITINGDTTEVYAPTGGGGGGSTDYSELTSKPQINGVTLEGNKTSGQLGLVNASDVYTKAEVDSELTNYVPTSTMVNGHSLLGDVTVTKEDLGLGNVGNYKAVSTVASQGLSSTEKSNARTNIGAGTYSKPSGGIPESDLVDAVKDKIKNLDSNGEIDFSHVKNAQTGHDMIPLSEGVQGVEQNTTPNRVVDALVVKAYSNMYTNRVILNGGNPISAGTTYIGTWDSTTEDDWEYSDEFVVGDNEDIDLAFMFEVIDDTSTPVYIGGYKWDTTTGKICIKFGSPLASDTRIAVNVTHMRKG